MVEVCAEGSIVVRLGILEYPRCGMLAKSSRIAHLTKRKFCERIYVGGSCLSGSSNQVGSDLYDHRLASSRLRRIRHVGAAASIAVNRPRTHASRDNAKTGERPDA